jgi:hypothetical protein
MVVVMMVVKVVVIMMMVMMMVMVTMMVVMRNISQNRIYSILCFNQVNFLKSSNYFFLSGART